jgi:alpha-L-fucosidase
MKKALVVGALLLFLLHTVVSAQKVYLPTTASLSTRQAPDWYGKAKLGIFIH